MAWACGVLPRSLQEFASFGVIESVEKAIVEERNTGFRDTALFMSTNQKSGKKKKFFFRHTYLIYPQSWISSYQCSKPDARMFWQTSSGDWGSLSLLHLLISMVSILPPWPVSRYQWLSGSQNFWIFSNQLSQAGTSYSSTPLARCWTWLCWSWSQVLWYLRSSFLKLRGKYPWSWNLLYLALWKEDLRLIVKSQNC